MDLYTVLMDFEVAYEARHGRAPKLFRRKGGGTSFSAPGSAGDDGFGIISDQPAQAVLSASAGGNAKQRRASRRQAAIESLGTQISVGEASLGGTQGATDHTATGDGDSAAQGVGLPMAISGCAIRSRPPSVPQSDGNTGSLNGGDGWGMPEERLLKPLPHWEDPDLRALAGTISRDIFTRSTGVSWGDVVALEEPKRLLKEAVVMPVKYPELFTGLLTPWCGILLYGPPGTGKTMLAKAVANECRTTFFNISASSIVSKYRGDSEKLVRVLFELARHHAPSTIFIDEIDAIMGQRGDAGGGSEHEGSRRMKTELLIQMDGLAKGAELVFVLAASNLPWELDVALLRRLEKRVLVPLPNEPAREAMLRRNLAGRTGSQPPGAGAKHDSPTMSECVDFAAVAAATEGYSGADIRLLCKEAAMRPVRRLMRQLEDTDTAAAPVSASGATPVDATAALQRDPVTRSDINAALNTTFASAHKFAQKYEAWAREFGAA
eukprot:TRINITY_DN1711_c0_g2_i1.p1 TRINITY_DN1711_c0_g2~~TRINITY_DN1711_c0_g2_i1.p1  ORF type:complete len:574 (-),score=98.67 TRINITY_DN1711_c0_g2_i1:1306-2784(-)